MTDESAWLYELNASLFPTRRLVENRGVTWWFFTTCYCTVITLHMFSFAVLFIFPLWPPVTFFEFPRFGRKIPFCSRLAFHGLLFFAFLMANLPKSDWLVLLLVFTQSSVGATSMKV